MVDLEKRPKDVAFINVDRLRSGSIAERGVEAEPAVVARRSLLQMGEQPGNRLERINPPLEPDPSQKLAVSAPIGADIEHRVDLLHGEDVAQMIVDIAVVRRGSDDIDAKPVDQRTDRGDHAKSCDKVPARCTGD